MEVDSEETSAHGNGHVHSSGQEDLREKENNKHKPSVYFVIAVGGTTHLNFSARFNKNPKLLKKAFFSKFYCMLAGLWGDSKEQLSGQFTVCWGSLTWIHILLGQFFIFVKERN